MSFFFSIQKTREIDYCSILKVYEYLTTIEMSNFELIYEVEFTSYSNDERKEEGERTQ